ncbi:SMC-Scp complex subunit ScpB [Kocuria tytonis]|uniref:SMC-Scp complex subunit ScpB n=2 Tax=Kocuria tytonis TaxID=2054280 RepID=A0A495AAJ1_9MICC|nr:SMC-Scp complex subunit ScpB [Kocuria tytonis]
MHSPPEGSANDDAPRGEPPRDLRAALEAVLMVAAAPVRAEEFARVTGEPVHRVRSALEHLKAEYDGVIGNTPAPPNEASGTGYDGRSATRADRDDPAPTAARVRGFELREVAGGWRIYSRSDHAQLVTDFVVEGSSSRLSQAALETLAVVAYLQPVSRSRVSAIRGVNVDGVVRTLVQRGLLSAHDRDESSGSVLYSTTPLFLEKLGLGSLDELPDIAPLLPGTDQLDDIED